MINRYDTADYSGHMREDVSGDYVLFEDYEDALIDAQVDLKELQKKYDALVDKIQSLWMTL
jgi:hypothetical protein